VELFGTSSALIFDVNLIIQILVMGAFIVDAFGIRPKRRLKAHGIIMTTGTVINLVTVLLIMGPSLVLNWGAIAAQPISAGALITLAHVALGLVALGGGVLFSLRFLSGVRSNKLACGKRPSMRLAILFWMLGLLLGVGFYAYYYIPT
jgi:hypothetical protein